MDEAVEELGIGLVQGGVRHVFGITGSGRSLDLITELERRGVRYHAASHEASAAVMAGAAAKVAEAPALSISIKGPGFANMLPGILFNLMEDQPAVSASEDYDAGNALTRVHKRMDQRSLAAHAVKGMRALDSGLSLEELLALSRREIPGPVHIQLARSGAPGAEETTPDTSPSNLRSFTDETERVLKMVARARRPALIVGSLAQRRAWSAMLNQVRVPVFTTAAAKGVLDEATPYAAGVFTGEGKALAPEVHILWKADLIIGLGLRGAEVLRPAKLSAPLVIVDEIGPGYAEGFAPVASAQARSAVVVDQLIDLVVAREWGGEEIASNRLLLRKALLSSRWLPANCFQVLNELDALQRYVLVADTGDFCTIAEHLWLASRNRPFLGSPKHRWMGAGIPQAVGAAVADPDFPVVCVMGDGGIRMYASEIKLAVDERLPICLTLLSDGTYASVASVRPSAVSPRAVTPPGPSWWSAVEAMGCPSRQVDSIDDFAEAITGWDGAGPLFVEAIFDRDTYRDMARSLR